MNTQPNHEDEIFKEKRKPKNPITFKLQLNEEQKQAKAKIEIVPVSFMRGRTFVNCIVIVDEAQNVTHEQMEMIVTRIGKGSKMIICGDDAQVDLKQKRDSGFKFLYTAASKIKNLIGIKLTTNHRNPIVEDLIELYNDAYERGMTNVKVK